MPRQMTLAQAEFQAKGRKTRGERFLGEMERVVPWEVLRGLIGPCYYPNAGRGAGPGVGVEDAIHDSGAFRAFLCSDPGRESVPDATTPLKFRRLLEERGLCEAILEAIGGMPVERGFFCNGARGWARPSSRPPPRPRPAARRGARAATASNGPSVPRPTSGLIHSNSCTAANEADVGRTDQLPHGKERHVVGDSGYTGGREARGGRASGGSPGTSPPWRKAPSRRSPIRSSTSNTGFVPASRVPSTSSRTSSAIARCATSA